MRHQTFLSIMREIAAENNLTFDTYCDDWIIELSSDGRKMRTISYQFPLNSATTRDICVDKVATATILRSAGVSTVDHFLIRPEDDAMNIALAALKRHGEIVVKPNQGMSGRNIFKVADGKRLQMALGTILSTGAAVAISPFYNFEHEYRVVILDEAAKLVFCKKREKGEWRHNLGHGAKPDREIAEPLRAELVRLAAKAADVLMARFCSVDIAQIPDNSGDGYMLKVLEVNSSVMLEHFADFSPENYKIAKEIYKEAVQKTLKDEN